MSEPATRGHETHRADLRAARSKPRRWLARLVKTLVVVLVIFGPWPVDDSSFQGSSFQLRTLNRLDAAPRVGPGGPIRVGVAEVDLTPKTPRPLAGFIGQIRTPFVGVDSPCMARALTVESSRDTVTVLTADLLLINAKMARAVIDRAGLRPDQVYFTSSHTHGGPGGWGDHPLEMLVAGAYDPDFFEVLADQLADVVVRSRATTVPAEMAFVEVQAPGRQKNRVDPGLSTHDALSSLIFRAVGALPKTPPLAILVVFGAHATVSHPVPPRLGGDYPSSLVADLKRQTGAGAVLFASGAVGDASPARPQAASQLKSAEALGIGLAHDLMAALPSARFALDVEFGNLRLDVDLPPVRLPFFVSWLRFSPFSTWWIADRRTHLQALRLGPAVLVGFPGDYSGHLADQLVRSTRKSGLTPVVTSFDGDFRGYLVSSEVFRRKSCYETRWMNFYGPWTGDYLSDLARRMTDRLTNQTVEPDRPLAAMNDLGPRVALAILLVGLGVVGWPRRLEVAKSLARSGFVTSGLILAVVLAFEVRPELVDWAKFDIPGWLRLIGLPIVVVSLFGSKPSASRKRPILLVGVSCGLLTASWLVTLMVLRGWINSGFSGRLPLVSHLPGPAASSLVSRSADQKS